MKILKFYLKSIFIEWQNEFFVQKRGVCIGAKVAFMLINIFLGRVHINIETNVCGLGKNIFRPVDDLRIIVETGELNAQGLLNVFNECGLGLQFTFELPKLNKLQFLDIE
ncbi:hypothetical protein HPB48_006283 [Haemaphysalis longicornis]|uniref:Reverse transcriptase domain-containing protein n=1 Tax=Haemaphysalis longicornis TaxID=44386 RepID=A0A9J6FYV1_HAELO|nr:hypothetical protein HPB48_006283 [Haemaphysalis longicornis]